MKWLNEFRDEIEALVYNYCEFDNEFSDVLHNGWNVEIRPIYYWDRYDVTTKRWDNICL